VELPELLTVKEAAEVLRCTERTVYRYIEAGLLSARRTPGKTLILATSLRDFIDGLADARG
jgi:excisionase family DNA binding protein